LQAEAEAVVVHQVVVVEQAVSVHLLEPLVEVHLLNLS
jgi:hypothetical protein